MKKLYVYMVSLVLILAVSCKEDNPGINLSKPPVVFKDTTYIAATAENPQLKSVLVEDFTGVRCTNCPKGHVVIANMLANNPGRIVALSIHGYDFPFFTTPLDSTKDVDMRVQWQAQILNLIGRPGGLPFGAFDRVDKSNVTGDWEGQTLARLPKTTPVNLYIEKEYNTGTRELKVKLKAVFTDTMGTRPFFSVAIAESGIITPQKDVSLDGDPIKKGIEPNYVHNHVMRFMPAYKEQLLPADSIVALPTPRRVIEKSFSITLDNKWNADKCDIVFYVHREVEIIHVVEVKLK